VPAVPRRRHYRRHLPTVARSFSTVAGAAWPPLGSAPPARAARRASCRAPRL